MGKTYFRTDQSKSYGKQIIEVNAKKYCNQYLLVADYMQSEIFPDWRSLSTLGVT